MIGAICPMDLRPRRASVAQMLLVLDAPSCWRPRAADAPPPPDLVGQRHLHRLRHDQPVGDVEIRAHAHRVDFQPLGVSSIGRQPARGNHGQLRQRLPLGVPAAGLRSCSCTMPASIVAQVGGHGDRGRQQRGAGDGLRLCGMVEEPPRPRRRLERLADLGLHHQRDVARDLAEVPASRPGTSRAPPRGRARRARAGRAPRGPARRQRLDTLDALVAERGQGAGHPELDDQAPGASARKRPGAAGPRQPARGLEAEGDRQRVLQPGPADHRRAAVRLRQPGQGGREPRVGLPERRRSTRAAAGRGPVSMASWLVAPQCTKRAASGSSSPTGRSAP